MHAKPLLLIHSDVNDGKINHINSRALYDIQGLHKFKKKKKNAQVPAYHDQQINTPT